MWYNSRMIAENEYISLKGMSREQRDARRESFLRAYARNGKVRKMPESLVYVCAQIRAG